MTDRYAWECQMYDGGWTHWLDSSPITADTEREILILRYDWDMPRRVKAWDIDPLFNVNGAWWRDVKEMAESGLVK